MYAQLTLTERNCLKIYIWRKSNKRLPLPSNNSSSLPERLKLLPVANHLRKACSSFIKSAGCAQNFWVVIILLRQSDCFWG